MLTKELMVRCMPPRFKGRLTDENVANINASLEDDEFRDAVKENLLGFSTVLNSPNYSIDEYVNAVKFITYTSTGDTNVKAWAKTFPDRYTRLMAMGTESKDINAHVRHFNKTKLVNEVREQSAIPLYIYNMDVKQKAVNKLASLMMTAKSEKVQQESANALLTHLKTPEAQKIELDIGVKDNSIIEALKVTTMKLAAQQQDLIANKVYTNKEIAHQKIITLTEDGEVIDE